MESLRAPLRRLRAEAWVRLGASRRAHARLDGSRAVVLCYHRVLPREEARRLAVEPGMYVTPETFSHHLDWLRSHFSVLPLGEIAARLAGGAALPPGACAITFDDGWRDNHQYAWPALRAADLPATIFLVTSRVGTQGAFWPDEACRRLQTLPVPQQAERVGAIVGTRPTRSPREALLAHLKQLDEPARADALERLAADTPPLPDTGRELLSWQEIEEMARGGVDFESHGQTHAILTTLDDERRRIEIEGARRVLLERGLGRHDLFAYPSGAFDDAVAEATRRCGHRAAFTTRAGLVRGDRSHFTLPRMLLHEDVSGSCAELLYHVEGRLSES